MDARRKNVAGRSKLSRRWGGVKAELLKYVRTLSDWLEHLIRRSGYFASDTLVE